MVDKLTREFRAVLQQDARRKEVVEKDKKKRDDALYALTAKTLGISEKIDVYFLKSCAKIDVEEVESKLLDEVNSSLLLAIFFRVNKLKFCLVLLLELYNK